MKKITALALSLIFCLSSLVLFNLDGYATDSDALNTEIGLVDPTEYLHLEDFTIEEVFECSYNDILAYIDACREACGIEPVTNSTVATLSNMESDVTPLWGSNWIGNEDVTKTHEMISFLSVCAMFADKRAWREDVLLAIGEAGKVAVWSAQPDNIGNGVLLDKLFAGHFYNPKTGTNIMDSTYPTAKTNAKEYYDSALTYMRQGDRDKGLKYLGYALHYIQDSGEPHHAANIPKVVYGGAHGNFEDYVDENLETLCPTDISVSNSIYSYALSHSAADMVEICANIAFGKKDKVLDGKNPNYQVWESVAKQQLRLVGSYGAALAYKFATEAGMYN